MSANLVKVIYSAYKEEKINKILSIALQVYLVKTRVSIIKKSNKNKPLGFSQLLFLLNTEKVKFCVVPDGVVCIYLNESKGIKESLNFTASFKFI